MVSVPIQLFLHLSKLINLPNPSLIMTNEEQIPSQFCSGAYFPIICQHYDAGESNEMADQLQSETMKYNPIFISEGNHINLMRKVRENQLLFTWSHVWIIPGLPFPVASECKLRPPSSQICGIKVKSNSTY